MNHNQDEVSRIISLLKQNPKGLTIREISQLLDLNRISTARYLESLLFSGQAEMRRFGPAKVYSLASRIPVSRILNLFSSPVIIIDHDYFIKDVNDRTLQICDVKREDLIGHHIQYSHFCIGSFAEMSRILMLAFEGNSYHEEKTVSIGDRNYTFLMKIEPVVDMNGQTCVAVIFEDITILRKYQKNLDELAKKRNLELENTIEIMRSDIEDKKRTLGYLRNSQKKYRDLVEDLPLYICTFESDGTITFANEGFCRYAGRNAEDILGTSIHEYIPQTSVEEIMAALEGHTSCFKTYTSTKSLAPPEKTGTWQQWITRAFFDKHGRITEYQTIGMDITERLRAEKELQARLQEFQEIIREWPVPAFVIDTDHRIVSWNAALVKFSGIEANAMEGMCTDGDIFYERKRPFLADLIADENLAGIAKHYPEITGMTQSGKEAWSGFARSRVFGEPERWVFIAAAPVRNSAGKITHVVESVQALVDFPVPEGYRNLTLVRRQS